MQRYTINCHYDMVISVDVIADNEQQAIELAKFKAEDIDLKGAECYDQSQCVADVEELTAQELRRLEREAVTEFVRKYIGWCVDDIDGATDRKAKRAFKAKLARIAYDNDPKITGRVNWNCAQGNVPTGHPNAAWLCELFSQLEYEEHPRTALYNRYARLVARHEFERRYKRNNEPYHKAHVEGLGKEQQKAAFVESLKALVRNTIEQEQEGNEYVQMVTQFPATMEHNALNLFTYFRDCGFVYSWQEIYEDEQGREQIDDYETHEAENVAAMIKAVFYNQDGESPYYDMQDIYVED